MLIFQDYVLRSDLRENPKTLYVFGGNLVSKGFGGQASEMRGEPNAVELPTKRWPGWGDDDFFVDDDLPRVIEASKDSIERLKRQLAIGRTIVWPKAGIGTGRAQLAERAPTIKKFFDDLLVELMTPTGA